MTAETTEITLADGSSIHVTEGDSDVYYAIHEGSGGQVVRRIGTFEQLTEWLIGLGNRAVGIRIQPTPPSDSTSEY